MKKLIFTFFILLSAMRITAQTPGTVDSSFGGTGHVATHIYDLDNIAYAVEVQTDGKIVVAGSAQNDTLTSFVLIRYNTDGSLDPSFGTGGIAMPYFGNVKNIAFALAIQSDNKIVVSGYSNSGGNDAFELVRYNANGTLDASFGTGGIVNHPIGLYGGRAFAVAIQQDGKIIQGGFGYYNTSNNFVMVRYNTNGVVDSTFGVNGVSVSMPGDHEAEINALKILPGGKIIAVGQSHITTNNDFAVARYKTNGILDSTFGTNGYTTKDINNNADMGFATDIQPDGKIVVAGNTVSGSNWVFAVMRFNADGTLDTQFGTNGIDTLEAGGHGSEAYGVKVQTNGKIVVTGYTTVFGQYKFSTMRLNTDGTVDTTFGNAGVAVNSISNDDGAYGMALQADGKIIVAGVSKNNTTYYYDVTLFRYFGDITTGLNELSETCEFSIYPNPAKNNLNIEVPVNSLQNNIISIYDIQGRLVIQANLYVGVNTLNIYSLTKGMYILRLCNNDMIRISKFIKE